MEHSAWSLRSQEGQDTSPTSPSLRLDDLLEQQLYMLTKNENATDQITEKGTSESETIHNAFALKTSNPAAKESLSEWYTCHECFISDTSSLDSAELRFENPRDTTSHNNTDLNPSDDLFMWENPSFLVKNLDTGDSYHVEEMEQYYSLVTLDTVSNHVDPERHIDSSIQEDADHELENTSSYLLSLYTADETTEFEIEEAVDENPFEYPTRERTRRVMDQEKINVYEAPEEHCKHPGCHIRHCRASGFCPNHEIIAKEEEDCRVQALYLIPKGARADFVKISGHGFAFDVSNRLYTVYAIEMRCPQSGASWVIYRRYQEFRALYDCLRVMGMQLPVLPPKKLLGSFEPVFIAKRQADLSEWMTSLLSYDRVDDTAKNPHLIEQARKFLTYKADQPPLLLNKLPVRQSKFFGGPAFTVFDDSVEQRKDTHHVTLQDFRMIQVIGRGSFGKVVLVGHRPTQKLYAMKILSKENIMKRKQVEHTRTERRVLGYTRHPFIVGLHYAFQTPRRLYFVLDYCPGGELFYHLSRMKKLPEHMACFYAAEITLALEHLHSLGVVYRDLKPENILLTKEGHIMLADFGLAKEGIHDGANGTNSLCGTPEYLPPEILDRLGHGTAVDWWNLGMVLYEMLTGLPPWYTNDRRKLFQRLRSARLHFPSYVSRQAEGLIRQLLNRNPQDRLGANGAVEIKTHPFFGDLDWQKLLQKQIQPPFQPCLASLHNGEATLNFETEFTRLPLPSADTGLYSQSAVADGSRELGIDAMEGIEQNGIDRFQRSDSETFQGFTYEDPSVMGSSLSADDDGKI